ncbi:MAG: PKD domain-containing protein [Bacteroidales bacterium]|nr:PKD domain-containing protein [Bacteroidales bacterium]
MGGDGFLSNPNILNPTYFAGPIDLSTVNRTITFTLTLEGNGQCAGTFVNDQVVLQIDPTPVSNAGPDGQICGQKPFPMAASAQYQSIINWTTSGDGSFSNPNILNPSYTPGPNDVGNVVVLTLGLAGCQSLTGNDFMWLTVHEDPSATISGTTSICEATSTPISIALTGTPPWSVTYTNGTTPVTVNNIMSSPYVFSVSPPVTTSYWVTASNDNFCNAPNDSIHGLASITINPLPDPFSITVTNNGVFCEGTPGVTIGLSGSQSGMNYELLLNGALEGTNRAGTGAPLSFGIKNVPGQYSIRGINPVGNCEQIMNDTVTVIMNPIPVTDFEANTVCNSDTTFFTVSGNYVDKISNWHWDFGDGTFATFNAPTNPYHIYPTYGTYQVILSVEDTNNCTYSISHPVEVRPHPNAFFSYNTPNCLGDPSFFTDLSNNPVGQGYISQWVWSYGDGTPNDTIDFPNTSNTTHQYAGDGTYAVTLYITNSRNCTDIYSTTITVTRRPLADFDFWSNCQDELAIFNDASNANGGGAVTSWSWDFGDPASGSLNTSTLEDPTHLYTTAGLYNVTLIVQNFNGCSDTIIRQVNVKGAPLADFTSTTGCLGTPTLFWADSTLINLNATATYHWDFGDGSTSNTRNTQYTYIAAGTYTVILTITDTAGCEGSRSHTLIVTPPPTALFSSATDNCQGQTISFNNQSTTETGYLTSWSWNFGDGSPVQTILFPAIPDVSHIYAVTGTFNVTLTVTNSEGCTHSFSRVVNVFGSPTADFMSSGHCKDSPVHFTDLTTTSGSQSLTSWQWNFGDPGSGVFNTSTDQNPIHSYAATGNYTVTLITLTLNGCSDTISYPVTIKPLPVTDFSFQSACQDNPAQFSPAGMAIPTIASWYWSFGDGGSSTLQSPSHVYTFAGTYTVTLTVTDTAGCENQRSHPIIIVPLPLVNFDFSSPACDDQQIQFTDLTTSAAGYVTRWFWDFGDGTTQVINFPATASVSHTYAQAGTFNVTLTVKSSDSCTNLQTKTLTILPKPTALFSHGAACQGAAVSFTDLSMSNTTSGISSWQWDFGDPGSGSSNQSSQQNPVHHLQYRRDLYSQADSHHLRRMQRYGNGLSECNTASCSRFQFIGRMQR